MSLRIKKVKRAERSNLTIRVTREEYNLIQRKALVHTDGNISEWIRYAAQACTPRKSDLEPDK